MLKKQDSQLQILTQDYHKIVIPDRHLNDIKEKFGDIGNHGLQVLMDYLNWDKYLLVQSMVKTINKGNSVESLAFLDGALGRIDALIYTLAQYIKQEKKI